MDDPSIAPLAHHDALNGLRVINRLSRTAREFLPHVLDLARTSGRNQLRLLDVACGGADVPLELARLCAGYQVTLELILADRSVCALEYAAEHARDLSISTIVCDAFSENLPEADIVTNSLFLHHLDEQKAVMAMSHFASRAGRLLLISDLRRSLAGWALAWGTCHLFSRSPVVHHDGPASVRAAWTIYELGTFATRAKLPDAEIRRSWPCRMLLTWGRHQ